MTWSVELGRGVPVITTELGVIYVKGSFMGRPTAPDLIVKYGIGLVSFPTSMVLPKQANANKGFI